MTASILNSALTITYGTITATFNPLTVFGTNTPYFGFTASTGGLSNTQTFCLPTVLLPIEVSSYDVTCSNGAALVTWHTESERDNDFFTIEQSCDGETFVPVKTIKSQGDSHQQQQYAVELETLCSSINYFRLMQTNLDGTQKEIAMKSVMPCNAFEEVYLYPNPANTIVNIAWTNTSMRSIELYDALGHLISKTEINSNGQTSAEIATDQLANGVYLIQVNQEFGSKIYKIVVEHP